MWYDTTVVFFLGGGIGWVYVVSEHVVIVMSDVMGDAMSMVRGGIIN